MSDTIYKLREPEAPCPAFKVAKDICGQTYYLHELHWSTRADAHSDAKVHRFFWHPSRGILFLDNSNHGVAMRPYVKYLLENHKCRLEAQ